MKEFEKIEISNGIDLVRVKADRFKTNEISFEFCVPLKKETASVNSLLISLLSHQGNEYPNMIDLNKKLAMLYGAVVVGCSSKLGENQVLSLNISSLDDRFSLEDAKISTESIELLLSLIFNPKFDNDGYFYDKDIEQEKRLLCEKLRSDENEKRIYALNQTEKYMFEGEPYAINAKGSIEDIEKITKQDLKNAWLNIIKTAKIQLYVVGSADVTKAIELVKEQMADVKREYVAPVESVFVPVAKEKKEIVERIDVKQGKLVLGFRVNMKPDDKRTADMRSFCDIFGGGPYSKLFANVREKLSLCYYCCARYNRLKSCITIECGCEEENMDKAVEEILNQLEIMKSGDFDNEFNSSKISLNDAFNSVKDDSLLLASWYRKQICEDTIKSPSDSANENEAVTKENVKACASLLSLNMIYKLVGNKEGE